VELVQRSDERLAEIRLQMDDLSLRAEEAVGNASRRVAAAEAAAAKDRMLAEDEMRAVRIDAVAQSRTALDEVESFRQEYRERLLGLEGRETEARQEAQARVEKAQAHEAAVLQEVAVRIQELEVALVERTQAADAAVAESRHAQEQAITTIIVQAETRVKEVESRYTAEVQRIRAGAEVEVARAVALVQQMQRQLAEQKEWNEQVAFTTEERVQKDKADMQRELDHRLARAKEDVKRAHLRVEDVRRVCAKMEEEAQRQTETARSQQRQVMHSKLRLMERMRQAVEELNQRGLRDVALRLHRALLDTEPQEPPDDLAATTAV
jgi:hypothetical protein